MNCHKLVMFCIQFCVSISQIFGTKFENCLNFVLANFNIVWTLTLPQHYPKLHFFGGTIFFFSLSCINRFSLELVILHVTCFQSILQKCRQFVTDIYFNQEVENNLILEKRREVHVLICMYL